jgi:hypothetical protein
MREARQTPKSLFFFLSFSVLVHGVFLWLAPAGPRPATVFREQGPRVALVNLPPPAPPRRASPRPPAPSAAPVPSAPELAAKVPAETGPVYDGPKEAGPVYDGPFEDQAPEGEAGFPGTSASVPVVDPSLREDAISRYLARIRGLIDQRKEYPYQARRQDRRAPC